MGSLRDVWRSRFTHYTEELQRYTKFIFTGHLAIVLVFLIGAGGYSYSGWLETVSDDFPAAPLAGIILAAILAYAPPVTLLKEADSVFFLPMEEKLGGYMQSALKWTSVSGILLPVLAFIVSIPLLNAVYGLKGIGLLALVLGIVALHVWNVRTEFSHRWAEHGEGAWGDRAIRFVLTAIPLVSAMYGKWWLGAALLIPIVVYGVLKQRTSEGKPFPFLHFIELERGRMSRFYRFANQFTDVPHLRGAVHRRAWLDWVYGNASFETKASPRYLAMRTFIRSDDLFLLWVRLTAISMIGALFIPMTAVAAVFSGALAFATAYQLKDALASQHEFRMDRLYPVTEAVRASAVRRTVRSAQGVQALLVLVAAWIQYGIGAGMLLLAVAVLVISEVTLRMSGRK